MNPHVIPLLWLSLSALCAIMAINKAPAREQKPTPYLVCYQADGGTAGNTTMYVAGSLTEARINEMRDLIKSGDQINGRTVIITSIIELTQ